MNPPIEPSPINEYGPVELLARHVARTGFDILSGEAVDKAKVFLLDTLGAGIAGTGGADVDALISAARHWGQGDVAQVWHTGDRLPGASAAVVNAYLIHCLEFDCVHEAAVVHPMASIAAAVMARCQELSAAGRPVSGRTLISALAVGVDVATLIGMAAAAPVRFYRPATAGGFGATAALCHLEGFDEHQTASAFGSLYSQTSGTLQPHLEGSMLVGLQIGFNARAAVTAVDLAKAGIEGPHDVLSGPYGYYALYEQGGFKPGAAWARLGQEWQITRLSQKPFPTGRLTHGVVDGLARLMTAHGFSADDVAAVTVKASPLICRLVGRPDIAEPTTTYAKLCLAFVAGTFLARGRVDVPDFVGPEMLNDPRVHALAGKVSVVQGDDIEENAFYPQTVSVGLTDGRVVETVLEAAFGHPDNPLSLAEHRGKFTRCCSYGRYPMDNGRVERLIGLVDTLESLPDTAELVGATTTA